MDESKNKELLNALESFNITDSTNFDDFAYLSNVFPSDSWRGIDDAIVAIYLKDKVEEGYLTFDGEDHSKWGYWFDGKGKVFHVTFEPEIGSEIGKSTII